MELQCVYPLFIGYCCCIIAFFFIPPPTCAVGFFHLLHLLCVRRRLKPKLRVTAQCGRSRRRRKERKKRRPQIRRGEIQQLLAAHLTSDVELWKEGRSSCAIPRPLEALEAAPIVQHGFHRDGGVRAVGRLQVPLLHVPGGQGAQGLRIHDGVGRPDRRPRQAQQGAAGAHEVPHRATPRGHQQAPGAVHAPGAALGRAPPRARHLRHHLQVHGHQSTGAGAVPL